MSVTLPDVMHIVCKLGPIPGILLSSSVQQKLVKTIDHSRKSTSRSQGASC